MQNLHRNVRDLKIITLTDLGLIKQDLIHIKRVLQVLLERLPNNGEPPPRQPSPRQSPPRQPSPRQSPPRQPSPRQPPPRQPSPRRPPTLEECKRLLRKNARKKRSPASGERPKRRAI